VTLPKVSSSEIKIDGNISDWPDQTPLDMDPNSDSVIRDFQPGGDLTNLYACADDDNLYVRFDTKAQMSPSIRYGLYIRAFNPKAESGDTAFFVSMSPKNMKPGVNYQLSTGAHCAYKNATMEIAIPRDKLGISPQQSVGIEATSMFSRVVVDKTGVRRTIMP
jgi:hypothetical protein